MKKKISLKWNIAIYLLIFAAAVIALLFLFQVVLLEPMYQNSKVKTVETVADEVAAKVEDGELDVNFIYDIQMQTDTCIRVFEQGSEMTGFENRGCALYRMNLVELNEVISAAWASEDHTFLNVVSGEPGMQEIGAKEFKNITYVRFVETENDVYAAILVYTGISSVNAATTTLSSQLLLIGLILLILIVLLTVLLNRRIAKPLEAINSAAKTLPSGTYNADPKTDKYLEAEELNATLSKAAEDISKADKAKRDLIANVSHDLRTPLTMISGYGEMMIDLPEEKTDENIQVIVDESRRLTNLVNDLLDLSKMQESVIELENAEFDLLSMIRAQMRKYDVYIYQDGFTIESDLDGEAEVYGDEKRLQQVFNNFMTNAINYSGTAKHIIVRRIMTDQTVRIEVQDFGEGISEEDLPNIWDRYYKVDKEHVRVSSGSGIGLSIVREILELHHAKYGVSSILNEGSTFWFELDLCKKNGK